MFYKFTLLILFIHSFHISISNAQNYDAEVLQYTSCCEVVKNKLIQTDSFTIQINNRLGDDYTQVSIPYSDLYKVSGISASLWTIDGEVINVLKTSEITDRSAISDISLFEDTYIRQFQLRHNKYPYKICYTYKYSQRDFIYIAYWTPALFKEIPTRNANLIVSLPKNYPYRIFSKSLTEFRTDSTDQNIILEWKGSFNKPQKSEIYSQPANELPQAIVAPLNFNYKLKGSLQDWQTYGNWQYRLNENLDKLPDFEKKKISELISGVSDKKEIVKILYHYLQDNTRYINVSIRFGGFIPFPANYVAENKYGDCKALTNYMKAMLAYAGIESYYVKVNADQQPGELIKNLPGPQFNHIVLIVPFDDETIWLENTVNTQPFGYMGTFTQNRDALLINENDSRLVRIPAMKKADNIVTSKMQFDLNLKGLAMVNLKNFYKGLLFEKFNQIHTEYNGEEQDRIIRYYMPFENYEVINWDLKRPDRDTAEIELNASLLLYNFLKPLDKEFYFSIYSCSIPPFTDPVNRTLPVALPFPVCYSDTLLYIIPDGYMLKTTLNPITISNNFGTYKLEFNLDHRKITIIRWFELYSGNYSLEEYPDFYKFIALAKDLDNTMIILKPKT